MARWALVLAPPTGDPRRRVGGLPLALRLALDAEEAGAALIVTVDATTRLALDDRRLTIQVVDRAEDLGQLRIRANCVVHRSTFQAYASSLVEKGASYDLEEHPFNPQAPYAFEALEVTDQKSARHAERRLLRSLRKAQDGWTARWLNRYISLSITRLLSRTEIHPNHVSILILGIGLCGAYLALFGDYWSLVFGAFLFQSQSVLDGCDGELSRLTHKKSLTGEWLDTIGDDVTNYGFFGAAAYGVYSETSQLSYLAAGVAIVFAGVLSSGIEYRYLIRIGSGDLLRYPLSMGTESSGWLKAIQPLFKRDTFVFLTFLAALAGLIGPLLFVFAAAAVGILVNVLLAELRMARERRHETSKGRE